MSRLVPVKLKPDEQKHHEQEKWS